MSEWIEWCLGCSIGVLIGLVIIIAIMVVWDWIRK